MERGVWGLGGGGQRGEMGKSVEVSTVKIKFKWMNGRIIDWMEKPIRKGPRQAGLLMSCSHNLEIRFEAVGSMTRMMRCVGKTVGNF